MNLSDRITADELIKHPIQLALFQKGGELKIDYKYAIKFTRSNLIYISDTLVKIAPIVSQLPLLRMAFLTYKIIMNVWKITKKKGAYWSELSMNNVEYRWD